MDTPTTTVPFDDVLAGNRMLLLSIPARDLTPRRCDFLGALFLGALTDRIFAREAAITDPPRLHLYIDEYARFATPMTAELFPEGRKYGVGLTVAHQTLAQVTGEAIRAAERQVGALVLFQLIGPDAEELAGELDTTPVRTKTTLQQRTESKYREWDEPVWDDPADEQAYKEANEELPEARQQLADLERLMHNLQEGLEADRYPKLVGRVTLDELVKATRDSERFHLPFNPRSTYYLLNHPGHPEQYRPSRGFVNHYELSYWTKMWAEDEPHEWDKVICEGYRLDISALQYCPLMAELSLTKRLALQSNISMDLRADAGYVKRLTELIAEVEELLTPLYRDAIFWFRPGPAATMIDIFPKYSPAPLDKRDPNDPFWRRFRADVPAEGAERREPCWMQYGRWITTPVPQAVAWLKNKARELLHERCWRIVHIAILERRIDNLAAKRRTVHHKEYLGKLPVKQERVVRPAQFISYGRMGQMVPALTREDQWYDPVEEVVQTHADRRLELANELVNLPPFTAYVRTATNQHHVALVPPVGTDIDESRIERIRQISKARFGRPTGAPEPPAPGGIPERTTEPPASPRIAREHPDEE